MDSRESQAIASRPAKLPLAMRINGQLYERHVEPRRLLCDFIRSDVGLTGTHIGCEHGVCGACTVVVDGAPVKSCLMLAVQARDAQLLTVEGLARDGELHPIQQAFHEHHGLQCGYCTPGMLLAALTLLRENPHPTEEEIVLGMDGNLCRCTGYYNIIQAVKAAAEAPQRVSLWQRPAESDSGGRGRVGEEAPSPQRLAVPRGRGTQETASP